MSWRSALAFAGLVAGGCGRSESSQPPAGEGSSSPQVAAAPEITGTLAVDGTAVTGMQCRPGAAVHIFVEVVTPEGVLRFEDQKLAWNGEPLTCAKLDRSWGGGRRPGNVAYWRGTLAFDCKAGARTVTGDLALDCGNITAAERAQLDAHRTQLQDDQRGSGR